MTRQDENTAEHKLRALLRKFASTGAESAEARRQSEEMKKVAQTLGRDVVQDLINEIVPAGTQSIIDGVASQDLNSVLSSVLIPPDGKR